MASSQHSTAEPSVAAIPVVLGFSHVNLLVDDLEAARQFYGHALDLEELPRPGVGGTGAWFRIGNLQLHLSLIDAMPEEAVGATAHIALHLPSETFAATVAGIEMRGVTLTRGPQTREQFGVPVQTAFCRDPSGNLIELTDVGPLD